MVVAQKEIMDLLLGIGREYLTFETINFSKLKN